MFDWRFGLFILQCLTTMMTLAGFIIIKTNDLKHLDADVKKMQDEAKTTQNVIVQAIKENRVETDKKLTTIFEELEKIKLSQVASVATCNERHKTK